MKHLMLKLTQILLVCAVLLGQHAQASDNLTQAELDQMLAPVALYPDTVLTHVLIAATYPLEVVQASRWVQNNPNISAEQALQAVENESWDPSVKALVAFPQLLQRLSDDLDWTQQLGEAFLADETAVLASIQQLREKAYSSGNLRNNDQVVVEREREVIVIEPARREVVYVPVYDTRIVYGDWWWPSHPPVYWHTAGVYYRNSPFYWGISVRVKPWFYFGIFDWHQRHVVVHHHYYHTPPRYYPKRHKHYVDARRWQHDTGHRRGVHYRHERLNRDFNSGYGYRQPTREIQGKPLPQQARTQSYRQQPDVKPLYQRKTADQVRLPQHDRQVMESTPRQVNQDLRQQRQTEQSKQFNQPATDRVEQHRNNQQLRAEQRRPQQTLNTEQLRQRDPVRQSDQRQIQQPKVAVQQPQREAAARQQRQPQPELRQPKREVVVQRQEGRSRSIE